MKLIVGLGNPGKEYEHNRHNVGFMFLDYILQKISPEEKFHDSKKMYAEIADINSNNEKIILAKPQTFMNSSGKSVSHIVNFYKVQLLDVYIVHDDLDLKLGEYKIQKAKGPKVHNGILSIEESLASKDFYRIRIGVDNRNVEHRIPGDEYVLSNFAKSEVETLKKVFEDIGQKLFP